MATHGSMLLKIDGHQLFLNTRHDGHDYEAVRMLLNLPKLVADNSYLPMLLARHKEVPSKDDLVDELRQLAGAGFEWSLHEVAGAIVASYFNRWLVFPTKHKRWLADYDHDPDITLKFKEISEVTIQINSPESHDFESIDEVIADYNKNWPPEAHATRFADGIIKVSFWDTYVEALMRRTAEMIKAGVDE